MLLLVSCYATGDRTRAEVKASARPTAAVVARGGGPTIAYAVEELRGDGAPGARADVRQGGVPHLLIVDPLIGLEDFLRSRDPSKLELGVEVELLA